MTDEQRQALLAAGWEEVPGGQSWRKPSDTPESSKARITEDADGNWRGVGNLGDLNEVYWLLQPNPLLGAYAMLNACVHGDNAPAAVLQARNLLRQHMTDGKGISGEQAIERAAAAHKIADRLRNMTSITDISDLIDSLPEDQAKAVLAVFVFAAERKGP